MIALPTLERFVRRSEQARAQRAGTTCELCGAKMSEQHRHVVDKTARRLLCACTACVIAFDGDGPGRFRTVPDRHRVRRDPSIDATVLDMLAVPVGLAFFFRSSTLARWVAVFPSVAGPTEAELPDEAWAALEARSALARELASDIEALLVHRTRDGRCAGYIVPVDECYELIALLRRHWRGIDGGDDARRVIAELFANLDERCGGIS